MRSSLDMLALRMRALLLRVPRGLFLLAGLYWLVSSALAAQGGRAMLWRFSHDDRHRFGAMSMLTGTMRLRNGLSMVTGDEQIYNGAGYSNWGYGVPVMQMPFQAIARHWTKSFSAGFFPDRAIYFFYLTALIPVLWLALHRLLAMRDPGGAGALRRYVLSWTATLCVLVYALYPLMSARFIVYEETICYLIVFELFALSAYVFSLDSRSLLPPCAMGLAAGVGLIVRPTGLIYMGLWGALVVLERRAKKPVAVYLAATAPFLVFWLYSNWAKTGSLVSFGYQNSMPWFPYHTPMLRFDDYLCANSVGHTWQAAAQLFKWFFVSIGDDATPAVDDRYPYLRICHFTYELRPPDNQREAFFGLGVLLFLVWTLCHHLVRRERRLSVYLPYATFFFLFGNFARGPGFAWRYSGDFWPLIVLVAVQYVRYLPSALASEVLGLRLALVLAICADVAFKKNVVPALPTLDVLDEAGTTNLAKDFTRSRYGTEGPLPSRVECGRSPPWPYHNGQGWASGCSVDTFTNLFLGVPKKSNGNYELRFLTDGVDAASLRVFVNGRVYTAHRTGKSFAALLPIDYARLHMPDVMVAIEWTREFEPKPGKLLSIELV